MNGLSIRIEATDFIGTIMEADIDRVGRMGESEVFFSRATSELIICQLDRCLVIAK